MGSEAVSRWIGERKRDRRGKAKGVGGCKRKKDIEKVEGRKEIVWGQIDKERVK